MSQSKISRINDVLYEIHRDIAAPCLVRDLAAIASLSQAQFHRVFREHMGEPVHQYLCRIRMEQAANQLMFDQQSPIADIAHKCGYQSLSSFSRMFKELLGMSPGAWRKHHALVRQPDFMNDPAIAAGYQRIKTKPLPRPKLINTEAIRVGYIRHKGYNRSIQASWYKLLAWAAEHQLGTNRQYALLHSNPTWVPLAECRYVACLALDHPLVKRTYANSLEIPGGLHASFHLQGVYGEFIPYMSRIMAEWVPSSGFKTKTTPPWVAYEKNQFLEDDNRFDLQFFLPIGLY